MVVVIMLLQESATPAEGIASKMIRSHCTIRPCMYFGFEYAKKRDPYSSFQFLWRCYELIRIGLLKISNQY